MGYSNSTLIDCIIKSPNHSGTRTHKIDRITPHCVVGQFSAEAIGKCFSSERKASCNYGIGYDGRVSLIVDEANRSWCSSSGTNDQRAVTIEVASDTTAPYAFKDAAYKKLVKLCIDICKRNGLKKVIWFGDKDKSLNYQPKDGECVLTVHRWFANKSCPGDWMYNRMGQLAEEINAGLKSSTSNTQSKVPSSTNLTKDLPNTPFSVQVLTSNLNYRNSSSINSKILGQTGKGIFVITEVKNGWGKLKSGAGWIYLKNPNYCKIISPLASNSTESKKDVKISSKKASNAAQKYNKSLAGIYKTTTALNIRDGAGTKHPILVTIPKGTKVNNSGYYSLDNSDIKWLYVQFTYKNITYTAFACSSYLSK